MPCRERSSRQERRHGLTNFLLATPHGDARENVGQCGGAGTSLCSARRPMRNLAAESASDAIWDGGARGVVGKNDAVGADVLDRFHAAIRKRNRRVGEEASSHQQSRVAVVRNVGLVDPAPAVCKTTYPPGTGSGGLSSYRPPSDNPVLQSPGSSGPVRMSPRLPVRADTSQRFSISLLRT